jgi:phosphohistidine swiveling domain-containing protein
VNVSYVSAYRLEKIDFIKDVKRVLEEKENNIIEENIFQKNFLDKERIISELKLSNEAVKIIETTDIMAYWQDDRKKYILQGLCFIEECIGDFSKRFGISAHLLHYLLPEEITLQKLKTLKKSFLEERVRGCFIIYENGKFNVFSGADYENFKNAMQRQQENVSVGEITGMCASIGKALGKVRICKTLDDIKSFEEGQILVTGMTRPEFVPAMKKASAIVTDEGGITSHAAVIAREFKKPCVIGTKIATKSLKNGDLVEVNANHGIVKKLK